MNSKPISAKQHAIIDYAFGALLLTVPLILGVNRQAKKNYREIAVSFLGMNAITDTPVCLAPLISLQDHKKFDTSFLSAMSMMAFSKPVRKDKKALRFHLGFISLAFLNYMLTDYDASSNS